jgi:hypothetical protein
MMRNDGNRQQPGGGHGMNGIVTAYGDKKRHGRKQAAKHDRGHNDAGRPHDERRKLERRHAGIMHRCDTAANDGTAKGNHQLARTGQCDAETDGDDGYREDQRQRGDGYAVSGVRTGIVRQHRDEMGGPDSAAADGRIEADPDRARAAARRLGPVKQADGDRAGEPADGACQYDQTPIMFRGETS